MTKTTTRRAPQGARGLKSLRERGKFRIIGRAPQGARGLKYVPLAKIHGGVMSRPARGAWVEILSLGKHTVKVVVAPRKGRVG